MNVNGKIINNFCESYEESKYEQDNVVLVEHVHVCLLVADKNEHEASNDARIWMWRWLSTTTTKLNYTFVQFSHVLNYTPRPQKEKRREEKNRRQMQIVNIIFFINKNRCISRFDNVSKWHFS